MLAVLILSTLLCVSQAAYGSTFRSERAPAKVCADINCIDIELVCADFSSLPYGRLISLNNLRVWKPELDAQYPVSCGSGDASKCQYACQYADLEVNGSTLSLEHSALAVMRSPTSDSRDERHCSFIDKVKVGLSTGAGAIIVINDRDAGGITMDTDTDNESLKLDAEAPPTFLLERRYEQALYSLVKQARHADARSAVSMVIDLRNIFEEKRRIAVDLWQSRLWECDKQGAQSANCERKAAMLGYNGLSRVMTNWLRQGRADFDLRLPNLRQCTNGWASPPLCSEADAETKHCIHGKRYCHVDPDGHADYGQGGRAVLVDALRSKCVSAVARQFQQPHLFMYYVSAWQTGCAGESDFTEECSLRMFERHCLHNWSAEDLETAQTTHEEISHALAQCFADNTRDLDADVANALLEEDAGLDSAITIDPTITVNGHQVRGVYADTNVILAMCSAFPDGDEPEDCLTFATNDCARGNTGERECRSGMMQDAGRTVCEPSFGGYTCRCPFGFMPIHYVPSPSEAARFPDWTAKDFYRCADLNECEPRLKPCDGALGGVCLNTLGGHECLADKVEQCTAAQSYGGCYVSANAALRADGEPAHACRSRMGELAELGGVGDEAVRAADTYECDCAMLPCHEGDGHTCRPKRSFSECRNAEHPGLSSCEGEGSGAMPAWAIGIVVAVGAATVAVALVMVRRVHSQHESQITGLRAMVASLMSHRRTNGHREGYEHLEDDLIAATEPVDDKAFEAAAP